MTWVDYLQSVVMYADSIHLWFSESFYVFVFVQIQSCFKKRNDKNTGSFLQLLSQIMFSESFAKREKKPRHVSVSEDDDVCFSVFLSFQR